MKRRLAAAAITTAIVVLAAAACSSSASSKSSSTDPASVSGTVTWWDTSDATNEAPELQDPDHAVRGEVPEDQGQLRQRRVQRGGEQVQDGRAVRLRRSGRPARRRRLDPDLRVARLPPAARRHPGARRHDSDYMAGPYGSDHVQRQDLRRAGGDRHARAALQQGDLRQGRHRRLRRRPGTRRRPTPRRSSRRSRAPRASSSTRTATSCCRSSTAQGGDYIDAAQQEDHRSTSPQVASGHRRRAGPRCQGRRHDRHEQQRLHEHAERLQDRQGRDGHQRPVVDRRRPVRQRVHGQDQPRRRRRCRPDRAARAARPVDTTWWSTRVPRTSTPSYLFVAFMNSAYQPGVHRRARTTRCRPARRPTRCPRSAATRCSPRFQEPLKVSQAALAGCRARATCSVSCTPEYQKILSGQESVDGRPGERAEAGDADAHRIHRLTSVRPRNIVPGPGGNFRRDPARNSLPIDTGRQDAMTAQAVRRRRACRARHARPAMRRRSSPAIPRTPLVRVGDGRPGRDRARRARASIRWPAASTCR